MRGPFPIAEISAGRKRTGVSHFSPQEHETGMISLPIARSLSNMIFTQAMFTWKKLSPLYTVRLFRRSVRNRAAGRQKRQGCFNWRMSSRGST
jgi:hypothetical protein